VNPQFILEDSETTPDANQPPKKSKKLFKVAGIFLILLLVGGGATAYFLLNTPQNSNSYLLSDKHEPDKVLDFDNQNSQFLMVAANDNKFQTWRVVPDPDDQNYYRFFNSGLGTVESLEVVDSQRDSSVMMAKSANDVGQLWAMSKVKGDYYRFTNQWLGDSKSLSHNKRYYYFVRLRDSKDTDGQLWKRTPAKNGGFYLINKKNGNKISLEAISEGDFKDKLVMRRGDSANHQWQINSVGSDYYTLSTAQKSLSVNPDKKDLVKMASSDSSSGQKWKMTPVGNDYFRLTNESLGEGKSLEAVIYSKFDISMVKTSDEDAGQLWKMKPK
jgi:hypothetical protein